ncbi:MAG: NAD(P)H-binding protein [Terriglobia bacterium]
MKVILFGASGMVGQGVLRECLLDPEVVTVLSIVRSSTGQQHSKLREIIHKDFFDFSSLESELSGFDACFFCLGVTSAGMSEENYRRITYEITLAAAQTLAKLNPNMTFIYVSGAGTDSSERGRSMWARVKGQTENALLRLPFKAAYIFRPAVIVPLHGIKSRTRLYRVSYTVLGPLLPLMKALMPKYVTTTEKLGRAMLIVAKRGAPKPVLENSDINNL